MHWISVFASENDTNAIFSLPMQHTTFGNQANLSLREKHKNMKCTKNMNILKNWKATWNIVH